MPFTDDDVDDEYLEVAEKRCADVPTEELVKIEKAFFDYINATDRLLDVGVGPDAYNEVRAKLLRRLRKDFSIERHYVNKIISRRKTGEN